MLITGTILTAATLAVLSTDKADKAITNFINKKEDNNNLLLSSVENSDELLIAVKRENDEENVFYIKFSMTDNKLTVEDFGYKKHVSKTQYYLAHDMVIEYLKRNCYQITSASNSAFKYKYRKIVVLFSNFIDRAEESGLTYKEEN